MLFLTKKHTTVKKCYTFRVQADDLKSLICIAHSLWADSAEAISSLAEVLSVVATGDFPTEIEVEKTAKALYFRILHQGTSINAQSISQPFFRLTVEQRFILSSLHLARWSYVRIGRILDIEERLIPEIAWTTRLSLTLVPGVDFNSVHPTGTHHLAVNCPEYQKENPWTQKFLDDEFPKNQKIFLQNHSISCKTCQESLTRCRTLYYSVDGLLPRPENTEEKIKLLNHIYLKIQKLQHPLQQSFLDSLRIFSERPKIRWIFALSCIFFVYFVRKNKGM